MPALDHVPIILYSGPGRQRQRRTTDCQADGLQRIEFGIGVQALHRYGHLYPYELDSLAERLEERGLLVGSARLLGYRGALLELDGMVLKRSECGEVLPLFGPRSSLSSDPDRIG